MTEKQIISTKALYFNWTAGILLLIEILSGEFFSIQNKNIFLQHVGFCFLLLGLVLIPAPFIFFREQKKSEKSLYVVRTHKIVTTGLYSIIRHPQYLGWALVACAMLLIRQHPVIILIGLSSIILFYVATLEEEKDLWKKFGEDYEVYMKSIPRWNVFIGIKRKLGR